MTDNFKEMVIKRWGLAYWQSLEDRVDDVMEDDSWLDHENFQSGLEPRN